MQHLSPQHSLLFWFKKAKQVLLCIQLLSHCGWKRPYFSASVIILVAHNDHHIPWNTPRKPIHCPLTVFFFEVFTSNLVSSTGSPGVIVGLLVLCQWPSWGHCFTSCSPDFWDHFLLALTNISITFCAKSFAWIVV